MTVHGRQYYLGLWALVVIAQSCLDRELLATTKYGVPLDCPICKSKVTVYSCASTNTFGGRDRDFLGRAAGDQPVLFLATTCPSCFYSGCLSDFESDVNIPADVRAGILHERLLRPMVQIEKGVRSDEIPVHVRYDLIAQTYQLRGQSDEVIAWQFLCGSWAIRLESELPGAILGDELVRKVGEWEKSQWNREEAAAARNHVLYQIRKGRQYRQAADSLEGEARMIAALAAVHTLRLYGENAEAQRVLPVLKVAMPGEPYSGFEGFLNGSIAREKHFQAKAVTLFEKALGTQADTGEKATLTYLCGELHRRLGNRDKAESYYNRCMEIEGHPKWLDEWVEEQKTLLLD